MNSIESIRAAVEKEIQRQIERLGGESTISVDVRLVVATKIDLADEEWTEAEQQEFEAVVARQFGIPCVVGASEVRINTEKREVTANGIVVKEGDYISVDGTTGEAFLGQIESVAPTLEEQTELLELLDWADDISAREGVRDVPEGWPSRGLQSICSLRRNAFPSYSA